MYAQATGEFDMVIQKKGQLKRLDTLLMALYLFGSLVQNQNVIGLPAPIGNFVDIQPKLSVDSLKKATQTFFSIGETSQQPHVFYTLTVKFTISNVK